MVIRLRFLYLAGGTRQLEHLGQGVMMPGLLVFLIPLAVLLIGAVVYDLRRRRRLSALNNDDISSAMDRARGHADLQLRRGFTGGTGGGVGG
jgi:hypothetical protein